MSNYWKKKLDELEKQSAKSSTNSTKKTVTKTDYWQDKMTELEKETEKRKKAEDIAPVANTTEIAPVKTVTEDDDKQKWYEGWFKKGNDDAGKATVGTAADAGTDLLTGIVGIGEKLWDGLLWLGGTMGESALNESAQGQLTYNLIAGKKSDDVLKTHEKAKDDLIKSVDEEIAKDLYDEEAVAKKIIAGLASGGINPVPSQEELEIRQEVNEETLKYLETDMEADSVFDQKIDSLMQSAGQLAATAGLQAVGVPWWVTTGATTFGAETENALQNGATHYEAGASAAISAGAEILTEKISGGISFGGTTLDDALTKQLGNSIANKFWRTAAKLGLDVAGEGAEEWLTEDLGKFGQWLTYRKEEELVELLFSEEAMDEKIQAFISGAALGGASSGINAVKSTAEGVDYVTGLTKTEEAVVNKEVENRIAEMEEDGTKLTNKQKADIKQQVLDGIDKGYISTDTIEEVLGGDTFKSYKETTDSEEALRQEYEELGNKKDATLAEQQRFLELTKQIGEINENSKSGQLKEQLGREVFDLVKDSRLVESYNENARIGQKFEADLSQYDAKQQKTIQRAIDSGILNNTNRTHEFVDLIAKISADKGVLFDFTNNERLKESGFAIDGKTVNGYVTKDGVTLNLQSSKSLNSVVGHEITHVLEGTDVYAELQQTLFNYAKSKGDYQSRYDTLTELYKGVKDANVEAELTADLVGDYLFTDADFINNLSTQHRNVFQKIYDEIKYLYKVATAGSEQARELEKVKKLFDQAYKVGGKGNTETNGVNYSLTGKNKHGIEVYETSKSIMDMSWKERKAKYIEVMKEEYRGRTAKFERNGHTYYAQFDQSSVRKPIYGDDRSSAAGVKALIKAGADGDVFNLVENSQYTGSKTNTKTNTNADYFDYFVKTVQIDGKVFDLVADVEKEIGTPDGYVYTLALVDNKKIEAAPAHGTPNMGPVKSAGTASSDNVAQNAENVNPKYSISDNTGKQLTKGQQEYFKDSKMRDDNGNLMVMYHGSQDAGFHEFNAEMSDDGSSFFFVDRNDVAASYSGTSETYEARTIRTAEDMNNFLAEIGYDQYEAVESNGKFELLENGEHVAYSDTAQGIYDEFCWYEGVGEGDANYKVYLNLINPLEVDGKGRPWNKIDAEFSQNVYDKYQSLTAEEKAALTDLAEWEDFRVFNSEIQEARDNELASAYAKMGEDVNIYDLFSVAADNFSEESMRENARHYLNTREFAKRAKEQGYDGVIFKNIVDNGGYSNGSEGASTVAIAFDSKQIKSTANEQPTSDPDIRYSLTEYTAEEKKAHNDAVREHFGKTYSWNETGYLLLDGTKLDLSGKHDGAPGGYRTVDHRDITEALGYDYGGGDYSGSLIQFMSEGNIRIIPEMGGINLSVKPTEAQEKALAEYVMKHRGEVVLDIDDADGYTVASVEYPIGTRSSKVLGDIRAYFENGTKPETSNPYSLTKQGDTKKTYGNYNVYGKDIALPEIAPMQDTVQETPAKPTVANYATVNAQGRDRNTYPDEFAPATEEEATAQAAENFANIDEADMPMEQEAPYPIESPAVTADDPFYSRDVDDRKTKAFETDYPDAKPFFKEAAYGLSYEYGYTMPAERWYNDELYYRTNGEQGFGGHKRMAAPDIETLRDYYNLSYDQIGEGIDAIINDTAKINNKPAKIIELILHDRLTKGYKNWVDGTEVPPNQEYINWLKEHAFAEASAEDFASITEADMPPEIAPIADDFAPVVKPAETVNTVESAPMVTTASEALFSAVQSVNPAIWDAYNKEIDDSIKNSPPPGTPIVTGSMPIDDAMDKVVVAVRRDAVTPIQGAQIISEAYTLGGVEALKKLRYLNADNLANEWEELKKQIAETVKPSIPADIAPMVTTAPAEKYEAIRQKPQKQPKLARATPEEQARASILTEEPKAEKEKGKLWSQVKNNVIDKGTVFETISLKKGNRELQARWNSIRNAEKAAQRAIDKHLNPIRESVEKSGKTQQFYEYMYHNLNVDRMTLEQRYKDTPNKTVFGDSVTADVSRDVVAKLEKSNPEFKQWADAVYDYMADLRDSMVQNGIISEETAKLWAEMYPHYVPVRRVGDEGLNINVPLDTGRTGVNAPVKRAKGGNRDILPMFDTIGQRTLQTFKAVSKNRFGVELKNTLGTTVDSDSVGLDEAIDSVDMQDGLLQEGKNGQKPTFTVFENGEKVTFEITEEMYDAMKPTSELMATTIKPLNAISNFRRNTLTQYNPWFMLKNAAKDIQDVIINSQHPLRTYMSIPKAIAQMKGNGKYFQEYMDNGGDSSSYFDKDTNTFTKENKALELIKTVTGLKAIATANDVIERIPRLAEYIASREAGRSVDVSMLDSARVTTNFAAGGDLTRALNRNGFTFLNASVQGFVQQVRNVREAKHAGLKGVVGLAAKYLAAGLPALLLNHLLWDDDEEYDELSDYVKENYYVVGKYGDGQFVRIPKGRMVAVIQNGFEQMENLITGNDEVDMGTFLDLAMSNLAPNNPAENNILSPIVDVVQNKTWYGEDLVPTRLQDLPATEQYDESTDSISRWLGETFDISPVKSNYLLDQYSGVIGDTFLPMLTPEAESGDNSFMGNMIAPLKDMFTTDSVMNNQNVGDFYDTSDELRVNANSSKATDEDVLKSKYMSSVNAEMGKLYGQKREIQNSDLPDDVKYARVREIQRQIDEMAKNGLETYGGVNIDDGYATVGDRHYRWKEADGDTEAGWQKITDKQLEKQEDVTSGLGISASEYWVNKEEYDFAYEYPEKYAFFNDNGIEYSTYKNADEDGKRAYTWAYENQDKLPMAKAVAGDVVGYRKYASELYDIKADKDSDGKSISGSRKDKVIDYVNTLDIDYGQRLILFKSEYNADDTYNEDIIDYLNSRDDISREDMIAILKELGFTVDGDGTIRW